MQTSGFFNALMVDGVPNRKYNADDYRENLAVVISNGVLRSEDDDLKVTASGMVVTVGIGRGWINGGWFKNDTPYSFPATTAPTNGQRYDRVVLRFDNNIATAGISLVYLTGTAASTPDKPAITRNGKIYDLVLADILVDTNATSLTVTDTRADEDLCGWVYSVVGNGSFFKTLDSDYWEWSQDIRDNLSTKTINMSYIWRAVLSSATDTVQFDIPQYDANGVNIFEVYVNGIYRDSSYYSRDGNIITFSGTLTAGTEVVVKLWRSIDGTGVDTIVDSVTALENAVSTINGVATYTYKCTGLNDNISLSQIAQAIYGGAYTESDVTTAAAAFLSGLGGNAYLAALADDAKITIDVVGTLGATTPAAGSGTSTDRYKWFSLGVEDVGDKHIVFNFAKCNKFTISCATNTDNIIFYGTDLDIRNADVQASCYATGCNVEMVAGRYNYGRINCDSCRFKIVTTGKAMIAENGTFTNCDIYVSSSENHALAFVPTTDSLIRVFGGTYRAYTASSSSDVISAVFYTYSTTPNAVIMAYNINCPTVAVTNFYQKYLCVAYAGQTLIFGGVSTLTNVGSYITTAGMVSKSKQN